MTDWTPYTRMPLKAKLYTREPWFREGLAGALEVLGDRTAAALRDIALVLIKPDGLAAGRAPILLRYLDEHGFTALAAERLSLSRFHWREMWRYQLTSATLDRLAVNDLVLLGPALLLLLRHRGDSGVPASVHLSGRKGPSTVALQPPNCLRRTLDQPNRILNFVHVADEPADILRELAILVEPARREHLLAAIASETIDPAGELLLREMLAASQREARSLDAQEALERVEQAVRDLRGEAADHVRRDLTRMRDGERIEWRPFARALDAMQLALDRWDVAALGAHFIVYDEPGASKLIENVDAALWRNGAHPS